MGWEDRPYHRDHSGPSENAILRLLSGSTPMFELFGIRFRAHLGMLLFVGSLVLLDLDKQFVISMRLFYAALWVVFVVLHELSHALAARAYGGSADEALIWPAGGLMPFQPPRQPRATALTIAAGPALNLIIVMLSAAAIYALTPTLAMRAAASAGIVPSRVIVSFNPFHAPMPDFHSGWGEPAFYLWWFFIINYKLLLLNLLPMYPTDAGQWVQTMLWPALGHFRSMVITMSVGMAVSTVAGLLFIINQRWMFAAICAWAFCESCLRRMLLREDRPEKWQESFEYPDVFAAPAPRRRRHSRRAIKRARRIAQQETAKRQRIDEILAKVSAKGMGGLNWLERRALRKTTAQHRRREIEFSKFQ